jgi:dTDP-4-amino-4,6-dideoxy-D-glucose ammonia-lyase
MKLGIVGGGRWAKIIQSVAEKHNTATEIHTRSELATVSSLEDITADHVWVANLADDHYETVKKLLLLSKNVLCEKPFVTTLEQYDELINLAELQGCDLKIGYEFAYSDAVNHIAQQVKRKTRILRRQIDFTWHSENNVGRHDFMFVSDQTLSVFNDLASHVLIILRTILNTVDFKLANIQQTENGVKFCIHAGHLRETIINVDLQRNATTYRRLVIDGVDYDFSSDTETLDKQLINFMKDMPSSNEAQLTRWVDELVLDGVDALREQHLDIVRYNKLNNIKDIVGIYVSKSLIDNGLVASRYDKQLDTYLQHSVDIIECYKHNPFVTQQEIQSKLNIAHNDLVKLNIVLQKCDFVQDCIVNDIRNAQYWNNTIIPLTQSGTVDRVVNNEYGYPLRIGLHIGQSCMFWCHFCGRNMDTNAAYNKPRLRATTPDLVNLLQTAPNDDPYRFYLSGGLETLTNPDLMKLITAGYERGFKFSLYTNGFMLTEKFLDDNPELWNLEVLRISLYGSNAMVYEEVTKHKQGFKRVKQNVIDFLKYRKLYDKTLRFGFNYIILPGMEEDLLEVIDFVEEVNRKSDDSIDFITLRENFQKPNELDTFGDREKLKRIFKIIDARIEKSRDLQYVHFDYGYALNALREGVDAPTMHCITDEQMLPKGFPQVDVVVDAYGYVYLCREAGFLDRPGNDRFIIGQVNSETSLESIVDDWIKNGKPIDIQKGDTEFMDSYEHIVSLVVKQCTSDKQFGIDNIVGPIRAKAQSVNTPSIQAFYQGDKDATVNK